MGYSDIHAIFYPGLKIPFNLAMFLMFSGIFNGSVAHLAALGDQTHASATSALAWARATSIGLGGASAVAIAHEY